MRDLVPIRYHDRYWSKVFISTHDRDLEVEVTDFKVFISTISSHDRDLDVKVTGLEFKC